MRTGAAILRNRWTYEKGKGVQNPLRGEKAESHEVIQTIPGVVTRGLQDSLMQPVLWKLRRKVEQCVAGESRILSPAEERRAGRGETGCPDKSLSPQHVW